MPVIKSGRRPLLGYVASSVRHGAVLPLLLVACFAEAPPLDGESSESGAMACESAPRSDCTEVFLDGTLDDWEAGDVEPLGWDLYDGAMERVGADEGACGPAMRLVAGPPREDGVVWEIGQDIADTPVPVGSSVRFTASFELLEGELGVPRICFAASPRNLCEDVLGFTANGRVTVTADMDAVEEDVVLATFSLSSKAAEQQVIVDEMSLQVCPP